MIKNYLSTNSTLLLICFILVSVFSACAGEDDIPDMELTLSDELDIATRIHDIITSDANFEILSLNQEADFYLKEKIALLTQCELVENDAFDWQIFVIDSEGTNAFTIPGGYIYFDKGLLKVINSEASFMNLLANEISYADKGFARAKLEANYGLSLLFDLAIGSIIDIESELLTTLYNQAYTSEVAAKADDYMVALACEKGYAPSQLSSFLNILDQNDMLIEWLDTHPTNSLAERIDDIESYNCDSQNILIDDE